MSVCFSPLMPAARQTHAFKSPSTPTSYPGPTPSSKTLLYPLAGLSAVTITAGYYHTCAIAIGGGVKCWGYNEQGQLGIGSYEDQNWPADVRMKGDAKCTSVSELAAKEKGEITMLAMDSDQASQKERYMR